METKHTKGEWQIEKSNGEYQYGLFVGTPLYPFWFAEIDFISDEESNKANAKLIAAAPDLLESLKILMEDAGINPDLPIEGFSSRTQKVIKAFKKATE